MAEAEVVRGDVKNQPAGVRKGELAKGPLRSVKKFRLCLGGAGKLPRHFEQRISDGARIFERSCCFSC